MASVEDLLDDTAGRGRGGAASAILRTRGGNAGRASGTTAWARWLFLVVLCLVLLFLIVPLVVVAVSSFTAGGVVAFPPNEYGTKWFGEALSTPVFRSALVASVELGVCTAAIGAVLGTIAGRAIARRAQKRNQSVSASIYLFTLPLSVPAVIIGVGSLGFWSKLGVGLGFGPLLLGHTVITLPFAIRVMTVSFRQMDPNLEAAAANLGAGPLRTIATVLVPLALPGIVSSTILVFLVSFDDVAVSLFLAAPHFDPLPVVLFSYLEQSITPALSAISAMVVGVTVLLLAVVQKTVGIGRLFGLRDEA